MARSPEPSSDGFSLLDWGLLAAAALMWGSSFLLIRIGLADLTPATIAWLRLLFGALVIGLIPRARRPLQERRDWLGVSALGLVWMAGPFVLIGLAERTISSALAGMINGAAPLFTAVFALLWFRTRPGGRLTGGLIIGFLGILAIGIPSVDGQASAVGVGLMLLATVCYGVAFNMTAPLQRRSGALPVIWRAELVALVVLTPAGLYGLTQSSPTVGSMLAMLSLGALSTGVAFVFFAVLVGRVGATRASIATYLAPVVAIALGVGLAGETVAPMSLVGIALVLLGAWLAASGRRRPRPSRESADPGG